MSFNFPNAPTPGSIYSPVGGPSYTWDGEKWAMTGSPISYTPAYDQRNRICNPAMQISQEAGFNTYASTTTGSYPADQWLVNWVTSGTPACVDISTEPEGKYIRFNSWTTADTSIAATDNAFFVQKIEGIRTADFLWGTANAKPVIVRFTVRCNMPGLVIGVSLRTNSGSRSFVKNVTLTANVWQDFVIPVPGDTSGTWPTDNTPSILLAFTGMCGSNYIAASENTWLATNSLAAAGVGNVMSVASSVMDFKNVGLYLDPTGSGIAPAWEMPDEASELAACQRYWRQIGPLAPANYFWIATGHATSATAAFILIRNSGMRTGPAVNIIGPTGFGVYAGSALISATNLATAGNQSSLQGETGIVLTASVASGLTLGHGTMLYINNNTTSGIVLNSRM